jgi:thymidylate synthase
MEIIADSFAELYKQGRAILLEKGETIAPRGFKTKEVTGIAFVLTNPRNRLGYHKIRRFSLPFAIGETIMLFADTNEIAPLARINKRMHQFSDDGKTTHGNYGYRIAKYIERIVEKLQHDPTTRQAILPIYCEKDMFIVSKDIPCTLALHFLVRNNKLDLIVTMRSNDFFWGFPYDLFMFTSLQEVIANTLQVEVGTYRHQVSSLHVYTERHENLLNEIEIMEPVEIQLPYDVMDMQFLTGTMRMMEAAIPNFDTSDPFKMILRDWELRHRKIGTDEIPFWAERFIR